MGSIYKYDLDTDVVTELWAHPGLTAAASSPVISPNGQWIAFTLHDGLERGDLWVMANDGSGIRGVSAPPPERIAVGLFTWSPDSSRIAYVASVPYLDELNVEGYYDEVYVVDRDGGNRRRVSADVPDPATADVPWDVKWSSSGRYVTWRVAGPETGAFAIDVHDVQTGGANRVRISHPAPAEPYIDEYHWAPDSSRIAYRAYVGGAVELYTVRPDGTGHITVNPALVANGHVMQFAWSPDSARIAYQADQDTDAVDELFTITPDGTGAAKVNGPLSDGTDVDGYFRWAPDSSRIAYAIRGASELYTARYDGSNRIQINGPLDAEQPVSLFKWSPDSSRLAYRARDVFHDRELYVVRPDGSDLLELNGILPGEPVPGKGQGYFNSQHFEWSSDSSQLVYVAAQDTPNVELFTVRPETSEYFKLNDALTESASLRHSRFSWSRDGSRIAYVADEDNDGVRDLYVAAPNGATHRNVSGSVTGDRGGLTFMWSP